MQHREVESLFKKYQSGECTSEEQALVEHYIFFEGIEKITLTEAQFEAQLDDLESRIVKIPVKRIKLPAYRFLIAVAATLILVGGIAVLLNSYDEIGNHPYYSNTKHDINPGKNSATLTLANGEILTLSSTKSGIVIDAAKLRYNDGTYVSSSSSTSQARNDIVLTTPRGGTYQVILPDQTRIWLNAASSIKFPASFAGLRERKIELNGEAFFIVKHNAALPFRVITEAQTIEDIGTEFNVNSYADELATKTTLLEGSAKVSLTVLSAMKQSLGLTLKPGEQAYYSGKGLYLKQVDTDEAIGWKNGDFVFDGEDLRSAMRKVARWYDVEVVYESKTQTNVALDGVISRKNNLSAVLKWMETIGKVQLKLEGRRITVMK